MTNLEYIELDGACGTCVIAIANDDYSGTTDAGEAATRAGLKQIGHYLVVGDELGFSHQACSVCGSRLAGDRHQVGYLAELNEYFDYRHQAWVVDGRYVRCGHLNACSCYGRLHEDELATAENEPSQAPKGWDYVEGGKTNQ